ncbi:MAG: hypothetical protein IID51_05450 [Proteobacteria bacterium]|nr:hypothetical protein [Pseudomonadota bacterium]
MFDKVIGGVTGFLKNYALGFAVAGAVTNVLLQLINTQTVDINGVLQIVVTAVVAGLTASAIIGAVDGL